MEPLVESHDEEALGRAEQAILGLGEEAIQRGFVQLSKIFHDTLADLEERPDKGFLGIPTGYVDLDEITRLILKQKLQVLGPQGENGTERLWRNNRPWWLTTENPVIARRAESLLVPTR